MASIALPNQLQCPGLWAYSEEWVAQYREQRGFDYLSKVCKHSKADFEIIYYICNMGEMALTKVRTQNLFIKRLVSGAVSPKQICDHDIDWQSGHTWARLDEMWEELFDIYNANMAPEDIQTILKEVNCFINSGKAHCQELLRYLADTKAEMDRQDQIAIERELESTQQLKQQETEKWMEIDIKHSNVTQGFIYLLSNVLMPGVYKIGFTAGNPDKRAKELSAKHRLPMPFELVGYWRTKDPYIVEQRIHAALTSFGKAGEFFEVDIELAKSTIETHVQAP